MAEIDSESTWTQLPQDLQAKLRERPDGTLTDALLVECAAAAEDLHLPVFWRPDPRTFTRHHLCPELLPHLTTPPATSQPADTDKNSDGKAANQSERRAPARWRSKR